MAQHFDQLEIWRQGILLVEEVYKLTRGFPKEEVFGLTSQMRRAAVSIPSNISEGFNRHSTREFQRFLGISLGSCGELETQLILSERLNLTSRELIQKIRPLIIKEQRMLKNFITYLRTTSPNPRTTNYEPRTKTPRAPHA